MDPVTQAQPTSPAGDVVGRRRFLRYLLGFSVASTLGLIVAPVLGFLVPPRTGGVALGGKVLAGTTADIPVGTGKVVPLSGKPAIVVNTDQGVKAYSAICTHLGCVVQWDGASRTILCPCHDGRFSPSSGAVVSGPPPGPLPPITTSLEGEDIFLVSG